jgi:predicted ABC-type ATPase
MKIMIEKSLLAEFESIEKATWTQAGKHLETRTDKKGHLIHKWIKNGDNQPSKKYPGMRRGEEKEFDKNKKKFEEIKNLEGEAITFTDGRSTIKGRIAAVGPTSVIVVSNGVRYSVNYSGIKNIAPFGKKLTPTESKDKKSIPAKFFNAAEYNKYHENDEMDSTPEGIEKAIDYAIQNVPKLKDLKGFKERLLKDVERANKEPETISKYRVSGEGVDSVYSPERQKIHDEIIDEIFSNKNIDRIIEKSQGTPYFIILGGRGGSGKSTFDKAKNPNGVYDHNDCITVDPDALKTILANKAHENGMDSSGWEGWKARAYHEESSDLAKKIMKKAIERKLNICMDITMSNADKQIEELKLAKENGYSTKACYMHVPKQESFSRAMGRYAENEDTKELDYTGRLVPPDVLLNMKDNEKNFDQIKENADSWIFYDNYVPFKDAAGNRQYAVKIAESK